MTRRSIIKNLALAGIGIGATMNLKSLNRMTENLPSGNPMPVLFLGHGSPMNAIEENEFVQGFRNVAKTIPVPAAILVVSAHWLTRGTHVTAMENPPTIHDFGGFPKELYEIQYPAPGHPELAVETQQLITSAAVELDDKWGLDHGAWTVVRHMYPEANIPVIQLSIDYDKPGEYHYNLGKELAALRRKGVLIIGSGNIVHNLRMVAWNKLHEPDYGYDWALEARAKLNDFILKENHKALMDYRQQGQAIQLAIPTPDHFYPLLYTLGLKENTDEIQLFNDKALGGSLTMTSVMIGNLN